MDRAPGQREVVGVVRNAKYQRLEEEPRSIAYLPYVQHPVENLFAEVRVTGSTSAVADGIRRVLTEPGLRETLRARGLARAADFSWDRSIRRIRQIYGEVAAEP